MNNADSADFGRFWHVYKGFELLTFVETLDHHLGRSICWRGKSPNQVVDTTTAVVLEGDAVLSDIIAWDVVTVRKQIILRLQLIQFTMMFGF